MTLDRWARVKTHRSERWLGLNPHLPVRAAEGCHCQPSRRLSLSARSATCLDGLALRAAGVSVLIELCPHSLALVCRPPLHAHAFLSKTSRLLASGLFQALGFKSKCQHSGKSILAVWNRTTRSRGINSPPESNARRKRKYETDSRLLARDSGKSSRLIYRLDQFVHR
ncbi:hypothetical protein RRG08_014387 [Elysia crispata]|uniref:Uncharacterized protein n=1 Tax=Elysia crispata TaxID=231223 RepID=A0AAE1D2C3_9GAST|nr:hypothetical protein RRG08_014387 [Elysia crispata]